MLQPCGGAIPICMVEEFDLPMEIIDRRVTKMKMISPSNREVDVGKTLNEKEWIGMCRREVRSPPARSAGSGWLARRLHRRLVQTLRKGSQGRGGAHMAREIERRETCQSRVATPCTAWCPALWTRANLPAPASVNIKLVCLLLPSQLVVLCTPTLHVPPPRRPAAPPWQVFDDFLRKRADKLGANLVNGLFMGMEQSSADGPITIRYNAYKEGACATAPAAPAWQPGTRTGHGHRSPT